MINNSANIQGDKSQEAQKQPQVLEKETPQIAQSVYSLVVCWPVAWEGRDEDDDSDQELPCNLEFYQSPWRNSMVGLNNAHYTWKYFMQCLHTDLSLTLHDPIKAEYKKALRQIKENAIEDAA